MLEHVPPRVTVTVTASPSKGLAATLDLAERLAGARLRRRAAPRGAHGVRRGSELADICRAADGARASRRLRPRR